MTEEDRLDEAEVTVVLPDRTVPVENHALSNESPTLQGSLSHKFEVCHYFQTVALLGSLLFCPCLHLLLMFLISFFLFYFVFSPRKEKMCDYITV